MSKNKGNFGKVLGGLALLSAGIFAVNKIIKRRRNSEIELSEENEDIMGPDEEIFEEDNENTEEIEQDLNKDEEKNN